MKKNIERAVADAMKSVFTIGQGYLCKAEEISNAQLKKAKALCGAEYKVVNINGYLYIE